MQNYINSKFKIFNLQSKKDFALVNDKLISKFDKNKYLSKLVKTKFNRYKKIKPKIKNDYLKSYINNENMKFAYALSELLKISDKAFIKTLNTFDGLPHRYEIFLKKNNTTFINDSKATTFEASKFALANSKNIFWILGGIEKKNDKINLSGIKNNIKKAYIIGKKINYFKTELKGKINFSVTYNLKKSILNIIKDIKFFNEDNNIILLSPSAASFDQFKNFENRGNEFKKLCRFYVRKYF